MFAWRKYSLANRLKTARYWSDKFPDRIPVIFDSTQWYFYKFRCVLVPSSLSIHTLTNIIQKRWFSEKSIQLYSYTDLKSSDTQLLNLQETCEQVQHHFLLQDGILYLQVRIVT